MKTTAKTKLVLTIVVEGRNIMGKPLCEMNGVVVVKGKMSRLIEYSGPVESIGAVTDAIESMFKEKGE